MKMEQEAAKYFEEGKIMQGICKMETLVNCCVEDKAFNRLSSQRIMMLHIGFLIERGAKFKAEEMLRRVWVAS